MSSGWWRDLLPLLDKQRPWVERICLQWFIIGFPAATVLFLLVMAKS